MHITFEIDDETKALYIRLKQGDIAKTIKYPEQREIFLDLDEQDELLGIEILDPSNVDIESVFKELAKCYGIDDLSPLVKKALVELAA